MATRPYQEKVDQFMADYQDKFLPTLITGKGTKESPYTNIGGPETAIPMSKDEAQLERDKILAASIHPDTFGKVLDVMKGGGTIPSHRITPGTPMSEFSNSPEGQAIMRERATPIPHVSTGFNAPTGGGTLQEIMAALPPEFKRGGNVGISKPNYNLPPGAPMDYTGGERAIPTLESMWGIKKEGDTYTLPGTEGTATVGPERFFLGGREVPAGTPGAMSGDQLARERIFREAGGSAIPPSMTGGTPIPTGQGWNVNMPGGGSYWETPAMNARARAIPETGAFEIPGEIKTALQGIQNILMPAGKKTGYSKAEIATLENFAGTLERLTGTQAAYKTKMAELGVEKPYKEAMGGYYKTRGAMEEALGPAEFFEKIMRGKGYGAEAERPYAFPPNSAVYQGAKLLGYVPEKPEAIHPIIRDVINKSLMVDPNTGMQTGGFDIRGARQKIGFMAPWLKAQGIDVPKESYRMTKPEFMAEQKAWVSRLPKKERKKYTAQYTEGLWTEYWGKD